MAKQNKYKVERSSDSLLTHMIVRPVSKFVAKKLAKTFIAPIHIIFLGLFVAIIAAIFGSNEKWLLCIIAAILIEVSHLLDCVDGELARLTDRVNQFDASLDAISDRIKDSVLIYASYLQALSSQLFNLTTLKVSTIGIISIGSWLLYSYIVDAHLIPVQKKKLTNSINERSGVRIYLGLYDLFIYGAIILCLINRFEYFLIYISGLSLLGSVIQILKIKNVCRDNH